MKPPPANHLETAWIPGDPTPFPVRRAILPGWSVDNPPSDARRKATLRAITDVAWTPPDPLPTLQGKHAGIPWVYINESVFSSLALTHSGTFVWNESRSDSLLLMQAEIDTIRTTAASAAAFTQSIAIQVNYHDSVSSSLALTQSMASWVVHPGGTAANIDCDASYLGTANISLQKTVTFTYGITSVTLRAPDFGNSTLLDVGTIVRKNRGGEFKVLRPSTWPTVELLKMTFSSLAAATKTSLVNFLSLSAGFQIQFLDHENVNWNGVITTPVADVIKAIGLCSNEIELEFRGVRT